VEIVTQATVLEHILANFLSNAVKFSKPGGAVFLDLEQDSGQVILTVTDEGPGILERDRARIFSGNLRAHAARPTGGESSSGMGLYLSRELARRIGATLRCEAAPKGGTAFSITLPTVV
jgi:signal transduction histidine kinase